MKYLFITLFLLGAGMRAFAQDHKQEEGALRTANGYLLYNALQKNSFTLELAGNADLSAYPVVKFNDKSFEFEKAAKSEYGNTEAEVLKKFMEVEQSFMEDKYHSSLEPKNEFISVINHRVNFWNYTNPVSDDPNKKTSNAIKTYFMDFVHGDLIFRVSYPSTSGNDADAKQFLQGILNNFRFYKQQLDFDKLSKSVEAGVNYYSE